ncbi:MAG: hypothetical protein PHW53_01610 [Patescibacteria group bacterium]|nr:hypothetical protein [Patescibacteria group bacterium]
MNSIGGRQFKRTLKKTIVLQMAVLMLLVWFGAFVTPEKAHAAINKYINYQGKLLDSSKIPVADGTYGIEFKIYDAVTAGSELWSDSFDVAVDDGLFSILLGSSGTLDLNFEDEAGYWLGVNVEADGEMTPRKEIGAAAYAFNSDLLDGLHATTTGAISSAVVALTANGNLTITGDPQGGAVTQGSLYINPAAPAADETLLGIANNGSQRLLLDAEGDLTVAGYVSTTQLFIDSIDVQTSASRTTSGAYIIGVADNFSWSASTNVQFVLEDLDLAITNASSSANLWTDAGTYIYNTPAGDINRFYDNGDIKFDQVSDTLFIDQSAHSIGIFTTSPTAAALEVDANSLGTTTANKIILANTTAAGAGAQQVSPALNFRSQGWSLAESASQEVDWQVYVLPHQYAGRQATSDLYFQYKLGGESSYRTGIIFTAPFDSGYASLAAYNGTFYNSVSVSAVLSVSTNAYLAYTSTAYRVGIGTNSPGYKLHVVGTSGFDGSLAVSSTNLIFDAAGTAFASSTDRTHSGAYYLGVADNFSWSASTNVQFVLEDLDLAITNASSSANLWKANASYIYPASTTANVFPSSNNAQSLGAFGSAWKDIYASGTSYLTNVTAANYVNVSDATVGYKIGGNIILRNPYTRNILLGQSAGAALNSDGTDNMFLGYLAGAAATSSDYNTFIGSYAGYANTAGTANAFIGYVAGYANTTGANNIFIGSYAGYTNTIGANNSFIGYAAGRYSTTGSYNSFIGNAAGYSNTTGAANAFIGYGAGYYNTTGANNTAIGSYVLYANTTGANNSAIGFYALSANTTGANNSVIGYFASFYNSSATSTVAIGYQAARGTAAYSNQNGVYIGYNAGYAAQTGSDNNIMIGYQAGDSITTGSGNLLIGYDVDNATSTASTNYINIGNTIQGWIGGKIYPYNHGTQDLGAYGYAWKDIWASGTAFLANANLSGNATVLGYVSTTQVYIDSIDIEGQGTGNTTAGAYKIGTYDEFDWSASTNVQDVLDDLDATLTTVSTSAMLWTDAGTYIYNTPAGDINRFYDTGSVNFDATNTTLYVDAMNNRVGVGTNNALSVFHILGSYPQLLINDSSVPSFLSLRGDANIFFNNASNYRIASQAYANRGTATGDTVRFTIQGSNGYVGIATSTPQVMLHVYDGSFRQQDTTGGKTGQLTISTLSSGTLIQETNNGRITYKAYAHTWQTHAGTEIFRTSDGLTAVIFNGNIFSYGNLYTSSSKLFVGSDTTLAESTDRLDSGAYNVGVADNFSWSASTNVQFVLEDLDLAITNASSSANIWKANASYIYPASTTANVFPSSNNAQSLGAFGSAWKDIYASGTAYLTNVTAANYVNVSDATVGYKIGGNIILRNPYTHNTLIGQNAGANINSDGTDNTFIGYFAGYTATSTDYNVFIGPYAGQNNAAGANNSFIGYAAGKDNTTGSGNSFIGYVAGYANTIGNYNSSIGYAAGYANTTGSYNSFIGNAAGQTNTTGANNTGVGYSALYSNTTGVNNTAVGYSALFYNSSATSTVTIGYQAARGTAAYSNQNGVYIGYRAGYVVQTGSDNNIMIGFQAGNSITTGANNILIGYDVDTPLATTSNYLNIGNRIYGSLTDGILNIQPNGDSNNYSRFATVDAQPILYFVSSTMTNYSGFRLNSSTGEMEYRDEDSATYTPFDTIAAGAGIWSTGASYIYPASTTANAFPSSNNAQSLGAFSSAWKDFYASGTSYLTGVLNSDGALGAPSYSFAADSDTGMFWAGTGNVRFSSNGASIVTMGNSEVDVGGSILPTANNTRDLGAFSYAWRNIYASGTAFLTGIQNSVGAVGTPSYSFAGDTNTGIYSPLSDAVAIAVNGAQRFQVTATGAQVTGTVYSDANNSRDIGYFGNAWNDIFASGTAFLADANLSGNATVLGYVSTTQLFIDSIDVQTSASRTTSGAYVIGVADNFSWSASTNVQFVLEDLDLAITNASSSANIWKLGASYIYPASTTADILAGAATPDGVSPFYVDIAGGDRLLQLYKVYGGTLAAGAANYGLHAQVSSTVDVADQIYQMYGAYSQAEFAGTYDSGSGGSITVTGSYSEGRSATNTMYIYGAYNYGLQEAGATADTVYGAYNRAISAGSTNTGVYGTFSDAQGDGISRAYGVYSTVTGGTSNYGFSASVTDGAAGSNYGVNLMVSDGLGSNYGISASVSGSAGGTVQYGGQFTVGGAAGDTNYGIDAEVTGFGVGDTNYGVYANVTGAAANWAGWFAGGDVYVENKLFVSSSELFIGTDTALSESTGRLDSGAYNVGVADNFAWSASTNVQFVLEDLDAAITAAGGIWTDAEGYIYPTAAGDYYDTGARIYDNGEINTDSNLVVDGYAAFGTATDTSKIVNIENTATDKYGLYSHTTSTSLIPGDWYQVPSGAAGYFLADGSYGGVRTNTGIMSRAVGVALFNSGNVSHAYNATNYNFAYFGTASGTNSYVVYGLNPSYGTTVDAWGGYLEVNTTANGGTSDHVGMETKVGGADANWGYKTTTSAPSGEKAYGFWANVDVQAASESYGIYLTLDDLTGVSTNLYGSSMSVKGNAAGYAGTIYGNKIVAQYGGTIYGLDIDIDNIHNYGYGVNVSVDGASYSPVVYLAGKSLKNFGVRGMAASDTADVVGVYGLGTGNGGDNSIFGMVGKATGGISQYGAYLEAVGDTSDATYGLYSRTNTGDSATSYGVYSYAVGGADSTNYGVYAVATDGASTPVVNYGIFASSSAATTNWAGWFGAGDVYVENKLFVSSSELFIGTDTALSESTDRLDSGAYNVGVADNFSWSASTNVQFVLEDLDATLTTVSTSAMLWTDAGTYIYNTPAGDKNRFYDNGAVLFGQSWNTFFVSGTSNYVGIGTATPSTTLHIVGTSYPFVLVEGSSISKFTALRADSKIFFTSTENFNISSQPYANRGTAAGETLRFTILGSNGYVGINTASPTSTLQVTGGDVHFQATGGAPGTYWDYDTGYLGIGTTGPVAKLNISVSGDGTEALRFSTERAWTFRQSGVGGAAKLQLKDLSGQKYFEITGFDDSVTASFYNDFATPAGSRVLLLPGGGNVGIGTTAPNYLLHVSGTSAFMDNMYVSSSELFINTSTYLSESTARDDSGAYNVGVADNFSWSASTNVQFVLEDLDLAITNASSSANIWKANASYIYPASTTANVFPSSNNAQSLGAFGSAWKDIYASGTAYLTNVTAANYVNVSDATVGYKIGGNIILRNPYTRNTLLGQGAGAALNSDGTDNTFIGHGAGNVATSTDYNAFVGAYAGYANTIGNYNSFIGYAAGFSNTIGANNTFIGNAAGQSNTTGAGNIAIGSAALYTNSTSANNTAIGNAALRYTTGANNTGVGYAALYTNTTGAGNTGVGSYTLYANTTGTNNTAIGLYALSANTTGSYNTAIGYYSSLYNSSATSTVAIGYQAARGTAAYSNQNGVYIGYNAGYAAQTGSNNNIMIGYQAGDSITTGSGNLLIGYDVDNATSTASTNYINIGNTLQGWIGGKIYPYNQGTQDLGAYGYAWKDIFASGTAFLANANLSGNATVLGYVSTTQLFIDSIDVQTSASRTTSGAYVIGVADNFSWSASTNVQFVLEDLDLAITNASSSANLWKANASYIYPASTTTKIYVPKQAYPIPSLTFSDDPDTGFGSITANQLTFYAGGTESFTAKASGILNYINWKAPATNSQLNVLGAITTGSGNTAFRIGNENALYGTDRVLAVYSGNLNGELLTVLANGSVGMGDTTPDFGLEVATSTASGFLAVSSVSGNNGDLFMVDEAGRVGINTTDPGYKLHVVGTSGFDGSLAVSSTNLIFDASGTAIASSTDRLHSGAYFVGVDSANITQSASTNVQFVLEDFDLAIVSAGSKWTDAAGYIYPTVAGDYGGTGMKIADDGEISTDGNLTVDGKVAIGTTILGTRMLNIIQAGTGVSNYGINVTASGAGTNNYAIYATATGGAAANWAAYFGAGNVAVLNGNMYVGATTETITDTTFSMAGDDFYDSGMIGAAVALYTNGYICVGGDGCGTDAGTVYVIQAGTGVSNYGVHVTASGAGTTNYGVYATVSGSATNYAFYSPDAGGYSYFGDHVAIEDAAVSDNYALGILETFSGAGITGLQTGVSTTVAFTGSVGAGNYYFGAQSDVATWSGTAGDANDMLIGNAAQIYVTTTGGKTLEDARAFYGYSRVSDGYVSSTYGVYGTSNNSGGLVDYAYGGYFSAEGTATDNYGIYASAEDGQHQIGGNFVATGSTGDSTYGVKIDVAGGDKNYGVYTVVGSADSESYAVYGRTTGGIYSVGSTSYGGYFTGLAVASTTYGVYANASNGTTASYGVFAKGTTAGVYAENPADANDYTQLLNVSGGTVNGVNTQIIHNDAATAYGSKITVTGSAGNAGDLQGVSATLTGVAYDPSSYAYGGYFSAAVTASSTYGIYANASGGTQQSVGVFAKGTSAGVFAENPADASDYTKLMYVDGGTIHGVRVDIQHNNAAEAHGLDIGVTGTGANPGDLYGAKVQTLGTVYDADSLAYGGYFYNTVTASTTYGVYGKAANTSEGSTSYGLYGEAIDGPGVGLQVGVMGVAGDALYSMGVRAQSPKIALAAEDSNDINNHSVYLAHWAASNEAVGVTINNLASLNMSDVSREGLIVSVSGYPGNTRKVTGIDVAANKLGGVGDIFGIDVDTNSNSTSSVNVYGIRSITTGDNNSADGEIYAGYFDITSSDASSSIGVYANAASGDTNWAFYGGGVTDSAFGGDIYVGYGNAGDDDYVYFDGGSTEYLVWDNANARFRFSDDLVADGNVYVGNSSQVDDDYVYFDQAAEWIVYDESVDDRFEITGQVYIITDTQSTNGICGSNAAVGSTELYDCSGTPGDIAEWYPIVEDAVAGDIVYAASSTITYSEVLFDPVSGLSTSSTGTYNTSVVDRASKPYDSRIIGIVSTSPVQRFGENVREVSSSTAVIALIGRVPTRVSDANGPIKAGDQITSSDIRGVGMKSTKPGMVVGTALEDWSGSGETTIMVFVNPMWYSGGAIQNNGDKSTFVDNFSFEPALFATSSTPAIDSFGLSFRGSGWDTVSSTERILSMTILNEVSSTDEFGLAINNSDDEKVAYVSNNGDLMISGRLYPSDRGVMQSDKYIFLDTSGGLGDYMRTNADGWATGSYDYAEMFYSDDGLTAGEIVTVGTADETVARSASAYQNPLLGIVSTKPGFIAGEFATSTHPVALSGRVPTRVTNVNGAIAIGDPITSSDIPGVGMKATANGPIVGYALEASDSAADEIILYVNPGWWNGGTTSAIPGAEGGASGFPAVPGEVTYINGDLDITGHDLYGVKKIYGNGYKWEIDENGVVISRVETGGGQKEVFGVTATQAEIIVSGSGITENGAATVEFSAEVVALLSSSNLNVKVIVTPTSANTAGLAVTAKSSAGFTVTELNSGTNAVTFDWMLMAPRAGYERTLEDYIVNPASAAPLEESSSTEPVVPPEESGSSTEPIIPPEESGSSTEPIIP